MNSKLKQYWKQGLSLSLSLLLLLTACGGGEDAAEVSSGSAGPDVSLDGQAAGGELLTVSYIDVGQGDSTFIELPDGKTMLIDAGEPEYGQTVIDYIESRGQTSIDYLVATHPHSDHIGGLPAVVEHFDIGSVYMPKVQNNTKIFEKLLTAIKDKGLKVNTAAAGVSILSEDGLSAELVAPNSESYSDLNNYSAVVRLVYGSRAFLFMGDAENKSEDEITADIRADVLKAGHHGSAYSTSQEFLNRVKPEFAVISCGVGNKYNHPEQVTLDRLSAAGADIFRTDELGTIVFTCDGSKIEVDKNASPIKENAPPASGNASEPAGSTGGASPAVIPGSSGGTAQPADSASPGGAQQDGQAAAGSGSSQQGSGSSEHAAQAGGAQTQPSGGTQSQDQPGDAAPAQKPETIPASTDVETIVYVTNTGSKYHRDGCQYLRQSKIAVTLDEAKASYEPCSKCNPPQ